MIEAAGLNKALGQSTAKECLVFGERPGTPEEIKKYRRSNNLEPGKRSTHYGAADDLKKMNLGANTYGIYSDPGGVTAADLINHKKLTDMQKIVLEKAEKVYKGTTREPLGHTYDRKYNMPTAFTVNKQPFGIKSKSSAEPAKDIIFPTLDAETLVGEEIYKRSHGYVPPGEQINRHYKWNIDPKTVRFGVKGDNIALNGVSHNITAVLKGTRENEPSIVNTKRVEDLRNMGDMLGQSKNLGQNSGSRPFDTVYGKASASSRATKGTWGAAQVMRGNYSIDQQMPDDDLGKSITPGFRNVSLETRAFGCPSIRTDLPAAAAGMRRSLADSQNYGDDVPAQDLINPPAFSDLSIAPTAMNEMRSKSGIVQLFKKIGYDLETHISDIIFDEASSGHDKVSINAFRICLNNYLIALETGNESRWFNDRAIYK